MPVRRVALALVLFQTACGGPSEPAERPRLRPPPKAKLAPANLPALEAALVTEVPAGTFGPYIARTDSAALVIWAAPTGERRTWWASVLDANGVPRKKPSALGPAPNELDLVAVKPIERGGFAIVSTQRRGNDTAIEALLVSSDGHSTGVPIAIDSGPAKVRWIDAIPSRGGALVLWARQQKAAAELSARPIGGSARAETARIATGARAWQVVPANDGARVATVSDDGVRLLRVDAAGKKLGETLVSATHAAELDLDAVRIGDRILLAWSDRADLDQRIRVAVLDDAGKSIVAAKPALPANPDDQALARLIPPLGNGPAYIAWEAVGEPSEGARAIRLASVSSEGVVGQQRGQVSIATDDETTPELAASPRGLAALTLARTCGKTQSAAACAQAERLPMFVELDRQFAPLSAEPMRLSAMSGGAAELAWGLGCAARGCSALAAVASNPAPVYAVRLAARSNQWLPPAGPLQPQPPPRPASVVALAAVDPLADIAVTKFGATTLVSWVTYFDPTTPPRKLTKPAPDGRLEPTRALLQVRALPEHGEPAAAETISLRARSLGGVGIAAGSSEHTEALLAWTALDNGLPQVFATVVGPDGKKLRQKMLTRSRGEKSDVAVASVADGFIVGWVDERNGDPELYVAKLNRALLPVGPERRITNSTGAATGVSMLALADRVIVVWADARDAEQPGAADPYAIVLKAADASPIGKEQRLAATRPHSFSPVLARFGTTNSAAIAWVDAEQGGTRIARLDERGALATAPATIETDGSPSGVALGCDAERCRVIIAVERNEHSELRAALWSPEMQTAKSARLSALPGPASQTVAPTLLGDELFYADQVGDRGRVRRMTIEWK